VIDIIGKKLYNYYIKELFIYLGENVIINIKSLNSSRRENVLLLKRLNKIKLESIVM